MAKLITYTLRIPPFTDDEYPILHTFQTFRADNGNVLYTVDDEVVTKDEGNDRFKKWCVGKKAEKNIVEQDMSDTEIKSYLFNSMDQSIDLITDYTQYEEARQHNVQIMNTLHAFEQIAG